MVSRHKTYAGRFAMAGLAAAALYTSSAQAADFSVELNQSRAVYLAAAPATLMVGNPAIADVNVEGAKLIYVLGKSYGRTNIIALDANGKQIAQFAVNVVAQQSAVTLMKGTAQATYNCTPKCEPTVNPSDSPEAFGTTLRQSQSGASASANSGTSNGGGGGNSEAN